MTSQFDISKSPTESSATFSNIFFYVSAMQFEILILFAPSHKGIYISRSYRGLGFLKRTITKN